MVFLCVFMFFGVLFLRVWFSSKAVEVACDISNLEKEKKVLEEENDKLLIELTSLKSPERISIIATADLGMIRASDAEVVILEI